MKLIQEELIEETADSRAEKLFADNCGGEYAAYELKFMCKNDFTAGARFAEEQLAPLFIEFATWCSQNYCTLDGNWMPQNAWSDSCVADNLKTSSEIFEEFITIKNKNYGMGSL